MLKGRGVDGELGVRIPDDDVCVMACGDHALARLEIHLPRRILTKPLREIMKRVPTPLRFGPNDRQAELERRDAAPRCEEVARVAHLHIDRARRMIGDDHVDGPFSQTFPQLFTIPALANRRTTLKLRSARWNVFRSKVKIVRTSLCGNRDSLRPRFTQRANSI